MTCVAAEEYEEQKAKALAAASPESAEAEVEISCPANLIRIFEEGLVVEIVSYRAGYDRDVHIMYESDRHEADVNRFRPHSVA